MIIKTFWMPDVSCSVTLCCSCNGRLPSVESLNKLAKPSTYSTTFAGDGDSCELLSRGLASVNSIQTHIWYRSNATSHTHVYWLVCTHVQTCVPFWVMEHSQVSLIMHVCYMKGCTHVYAARVDTYVGMYTYACRLLVVDKALEG